MKLLYNTSYKTATITRGTQLLWSSELIRPWFKPANFRISDAAEETVFNFRRKHSFFSYVFDISFTDTSNRIQAIQYHDSNSKMLINDKLTLSVKNKSWFSRTRIFYANQRAVGTFLIKGNIFSSKKTIEVSLSNPDLLDYCLILLLIQRNIRLLKSD
ncbi:hypothetical protein TPENAI_20154 [Tenacibaculum litopenaei]|jgi:hypothetical protein|uniref:hypothetical protein n=1 Tax=Tenacibaculum litopenaei TaxID=396016 RepID=UPI0038945AAF